MARNSFQKLEHEISRLEGLYLTSRYAFEKTAASVRSQIKKGELDPNESFPLSDIDPATPIIRKGYAFLNRIKKQYPRYLRETIFVRLISALEVYLLDVVRDLFLNRRDLFHSDKRIDFSHREILAPNTVTDIWTKVLNQELRRLHSQGFREIMKFYSQQLGIDLRRSPISPDVLLEMHDRRHLLVHRLGRTDDQYRRTYNLSIKNVGVPENYLFESISGIMNFALFIWSELTDLINSSDKKEDKSETQREKVTVQVVTENGLTLIDPQYCFYVDNRIVSLSDILTLNVPVGNKNVLTLSGPRASIREYIKRIGRATKAGDIILCDRRVLHQTDKKVRCHLPVSVVESIARSLPIQPWPKAVHKQIASSLGISNTQASAAIRLILETPNLKALIGKDLEATKPRNDISDKSQGNIGINNDSRAENDKDVAS